MLTKEQQDALSLAKKGHNCFIGGQAGTGKSFLVTKIFDELSLQGKKVSVTCTTGLACTHYPARCKASTLHRWSGIQDGRYDTLEIAELIRHNVKFKHVYETILSTDVLIVDEVSMLSRKIFEQLEEICSLKNNKLIFGGIQLIFTGDFYQLPPVKNSMYGDDGKFCFQSALFSQVFHKIILNNVQRQADSELVDVINDVSRGNISEDTVQYVTSLSRPLQQEDNECGVKLFSTNFLVDNHNRKCLMDWPGEMFQYKCNEKGDQKHLSRILAPSTLWLKRNCPVILLRNLSDKLVNGLIGVVLECDPSGPVVRFPSVDITTTIEKVAFSEYSPDLKRNIAERTQVPLKPAFALTIHKAQGMTLPRVEIDCRQIFLPGQLGVGIGRVTSKDGLRVINFSRNSCPPQPCIIDEFIKSEPKQEEPGLLCCLRERGHWFSNIYGCAQAAGLHFAAFAFLDITDCPRIMLLRDFLYWTALGFPKQAEADAYTFTPGDIEALNSLWSEADNTTSQEECHIDDDEDDFDEEFDEIIASHTEDDLSDNIPELPQGFSASEVLNSLIIEQVFTPVQAETNDAIKLLLRKEYTSKVNMFCNKEFCALRELMEVLDLSDSGPKPVKANKLSEFYTKCHEHQTSTEMRCNSMLLFIDLPSPVSSQVSGHICYNLHVAMRKYLLQEKEKLFTVLGRETSQRHITSSSRGKVRYVAGYCVAKVRYKYIKAQYSNCYKTSTEAQSKYEEACGIIKVLDQMRQNEQSLEETSLYPDTLLETAQKQNVSRGLLNVSDDMYTFFIKVCEKCLELLVEKNINIHGDQLYEYCSSVLCDSKELYEAFIKTVSATQMQDLSSELSVSSLLEDMVSIVAVTQQVYKELITKFLLVMLNQFRKDFLQALSVEKRMAHRKQIQVRTKKLQTSPKIDFEFVSKDRSEGKSVSHSLLKGMILKDKNFLTCMTKKQLTLLSKAYNAGCLSKDTKATLIKKLNSVIVEENSVPNTECLVSEDVDTGLQERSTETGPFSREPEPGPSNESAPGPMYEPEPGARYEPEPGPSYESEPGPSRKRRHSHKPQPSREPGSEPSCEPRPIRKRRPSLEPVSEPSCEPVSEPSCELVSEPSCEPRPIRKRRPSHEPGSGPSYEPGPSQETGQNISDSHVTYGDEPELNATEQDSCKICMSECFGDCICCEGCDLWLHRKCAGLANVLKWKKFKKKNVKFFCKDCQ